MTNQQGAPEALRLADALASNYFDGKHGRDVWDAASAELRRLHAENERLATLAEAQQPSPSAAAFDEHGFRDWVLRNLPKGSIIGNGEWWADHLTSWAKRFVKAAPQPSPTPQADSQPTKFTEILQSWCGARCLPMPSSDDCQSLLLSLEAARAPADSVLEDAARLERERICAAIKAEDDYCVDQGDYMLDSGDCIKIVRGEWVRPDFTIDAARKQGGA